MNRPVILLAVTLLITVSVAGQEPVPVTEVEVGQGEPEILEAEIHELGTDWTQSSVQESGLMDHDKGEPK